MKSALVACIVLFVAVEAWLVTRCLSQHRSFAEAVTIGLGEPAAQMVLVDFTLFGGIVFVWMIFDAKKRAKNAWVWAPLMILAPTVALAGYLLSRGSTNDA